MQTGEFGPYPGVDPEENYDGIAIPAGAIGYAVEKDFNKKAPRGVYLYLVGLSETDYVSEVSVDLEFTERVPLWAVPSEALAELAEDKRI